MTNFRHYLSRAADVALIAVAAFLCIGTIFAHLPHSSRTLPKTSEEFDPDLQSINSLDAAVAYVRGEYPGHDPKALADAADEFVRRRFFHDYSHFAPGENWLAFLAGFLWSDLDSPVRPHDILRYPEAACSQQAIMFEALARRMGLETGSVRMSHHMTPAVKIGGQWTVYDSDREIRPRSYPLAKLLAGDPSVLAVYGRFGQTIGLAGQAAHGQIKLTDVNHNPALPASIFDAVTGFLSRFGWVLALSLVLLRLRRPGRSPARFTRPTLAS